MARESRIPHTFVLTLVLAGLSMIGPFATDTYLPSFQAISQNFGVSPVMMQQTLSVYIASFAVMTLFYGTLSDSFGRRPVILVALCVFAIASIGAACTQSFSMLLFFRGLQGASAGAGRVIGQAIVRDRFDGAHAQRMISHIAMVFGIAPVIAPIAGGLLHVHFGWRSNFVLMMGIGLILLASSYFALPETLPRESRHPFRPGPIVRNYVRALRHPRFVCCALAIGFGFGSFAIYIASAPKFIMDILRLSETEFAWLFIPMISGTVLGSAIVSRIAHRIRPAKLIRIGFGIMAIGALLNLTYTGLNGVNVTVPWAVLPIMVCSFGLALAIPGMTVATLDIFPEMRGLSSSLQSFAQMLIFAIISGFVAPLIYASAFELATGVTVSVMLSMTLWWLGTSQKIIPPGRGEQG